MFVQFCEEKLYQKQEEYIEEVCMKYDMKKYDIWAKLHGTFVTYIGFQQTNETFCFLHFTHSNLKRNGNKKVAH